MSSHRLIDGDIRLIEGAHRRSRVIRDPLSTVKISVKYLKSWSHCGVKSIYLNDNPAALVSALTRRVPLKPMCWEHRLSLPVIVCTPPPRSNVLS